MEIEVKGAEKFEKLGKALRSLNDRELSKRFYAGINRASKPLRNSARANITAKFPTRGGMAAEMYRDTKVSTKRRATGRHAGVRITAVSQHDVRRMNNTGSWRHPVHGSSTWVDQKDPKVKGWFDDPLQAGAAQVRDALVEVFDDIERDIGKAIG